MIFLPLHITTRGNNRQHWRKEWRKTKVERETACLAVKAAPKPPLPVTVTITRCGPRFLDRHNLPSAAKAVIDGVCDAYGVDDREYEKIDFKFAQRKQSLVGVEIKISRMIHADNQHKGD